MKARRLRPVGQASPERQLRGTFSFSLNDATFGWHAGNGVERSDGRGRILVTSQAGTGAVRIPVGERLPYEFVLPVFVRRYLTYAFPNNL
ncbi:hypothetical protein Mal4_33940 [Maioricimonas rarisocia]|uniref:Uncharacterized protein n=1 Tax=Maioricimonas rarisocia TaxID=2528026 RepID=A0A517Z9D0_9PLAN|nr:hypothetical protein [Maioricimonas rarisocia]QDU39059.1 hypothetical protein Mal4_33940 [Maioricimonas rarisocia]